MARTNLNVTPRAETGKGPNRRLRVVGSIPGVVYGKAKAPVAVSADPKAVVAILKGELGRNTPIALTVEGEKAERLAIIKDFQLHPWKRKISHVDFWEITEETELVLTVPFKRVGRAEAERVGARVRLTRDDVKVRCTAATVPAFVGFDMTNVPAEDLTVTVGELPMPEGVTAVFKNNYSILQMTIPRANEGEEEEGEGDK